MNPEGISSVPISSSSSDMKTPILSDTDFHRLSPIIKLKGENILSPCNVAID
jgi:hypothetical protein